MRLYAALSLCLILGLAGCSETDEETLSIITIGETDTLFEEGFRLAPEAQMLRDATQAGIVSINAEGEVVPALGESWIVTDNGRSFFFRLRQARWRNGDPVTAEEARESLLRSIEALDGTSLGLDLRKVEEVRAMTARVIEIRLTGPMPEFLQLLAQPELAITREGEGLGALALTREEEVALLTPVPPEEIGLPGDEREEPETTIRLRALPPEQATAAFANGESAAVLGGDLWNLPLADAGPLARGTIRVDPALGLLGMVVRSETGFLEDPANRQAISKAIDRATLMEGFNLSGWRGSTLIVPDGLPDDPEVRGERWASLSLEERQAQAQATVQAWVGSTGQRPVVRLWLPEGPGSDILFDALSLDLAIVGIDLRRAQFSRSADLIMIDRPARYASARWFLNQFHCSLLPGPCSEDADLLVRDALTAPDATGSTILLAEAEGALLAQEAYIPLGAPVRWSLVRSGLEGFAENPWARHPLYALIGRDAL